MSLEKKSKNLNDFTLEEASIDEIKNMEEDDPYFVVFNLNLDKGYPKKKPIEYASELMKKYKPDISCFPESGNFKKSSSKTKQKKKEGDNNKKSSLDFFEDIDHNNISSKHLAFKDDYISLITNMNHFDVNKNIQNIYNQCCISSFIVDVKPRIINKDGMEKILPDINPFFIDNYDDIINNSDKKYEEIKNKTLRSRKNWIFTFQVFCVHIPKKKSFTEICLNVIIESFKLFSNLKNYSIYVFFLNQNYREYNLIFKKISNESKDILVKFENNFFNLLKKYELLSIKFMESWKETCLEANKKRKETLEISKLKNLYDDKNKDVNGKSADNLTILNKDDKNNNDKLNILDDDGDKNNNDKLNILNNDDDNKNKDVGEKNVDKKIFKNSIVKHVNKVKDSNNIKKPLVNEKIESPKLSTKKKVQFDDENCEKIDIFNKKVINYYSDNLSPIYDESINNIKNSFDGVIILGDFNISIQKMDEYINMNKISRNKISIPEYSFKYNNKKKVVSEKTTNSERGSYIDYCLYSKNDILDKRVDLIIENENSEKMSHKAVITNIFIS